MLIEIIKADNILCGKCKSFDGSLLLKKETGKMNYLCCNCNNTFEIDKWEK